MNTTKTLGNSLRELREKKGISKYVVERDTGLTAMTIKKIESGGGCHVSSLLKYLNALNVTMKFVPAEKTP